MIQTSIECSWLHYAQSWLFACFICFWCFLKLYKAKMHPSDLKINSSMLKIDIIALQMFDQQSHIEFRCNVGGKPVFTSRHIFFSVFEVLVCFDATLAALKRLSLVFFFCANIGWNLFFFCQHWSIVLLT